MNKKILIVEDEKSLQLAIKLKLEKEGMKVLLAKSVDVALEVLKKNKTVDIIWLDHYLLGSQNGLDFVIKIKENDTWSKIPVFVVSNTATQEKVEKYLKLGVYKYYTKADLKLEHIIKEI